MWSRALARRLGLRVAAWVAVLAAATLSAGAEASRPCASVSFEGQSFTACTADLREHDIHLFLKRPDGTPYGALAALPEDGLLFATNAGMFTPEHAPAGLYVEAGQQLTSLNTVVSGYGNFHMQPNGVFWIAGGRAAVTPTDTFAKLKAKPDLATQSGPMLVIKDLVNRKFEADGSSRYVRNGVGVDRRGRVVIAISDAPVSFGRFARLFQSALECPNALYLDGSVSQLRIPGERSAESGRPLGPLLGVYRRDR